VIRPILKSHVDSCGRRIGTYVKAGGESNMDVGDRSNDAVRIDARELNCKVVGEGGNLGFSQLGRIEFARPRPANTDFHRQFGGGELLRRGGESEDPAQRRVRSKEITRKARDRLLVQMTMNRGWFYQQLPSRSGRSSTASSRPRSASRKAYVIARWNARGPESLAGDSAVR